MKILREFFILGLTAFGGPTAHVGFFRDRFVEKLKWLDESEFADTLALCQFLPGPASSQLGFAIGWKKGGWLGAFAAWLGFTLPSAIAMTLIGIGVAHFSENSNLGWLAGLQIAVVVVIFKAVLEMARSLCPDKTTTLIAIAAAAFMLWNPLPFSQIIVILVGAILGLSILQLNRVDSATQQQLKTGLRLNAPHQSHENGYPENQRLNPHVTWQDRAETPSRLNRVESLTQQGRVAGIVCLVLFFVLLFGLPLVSGTSGIAALFASFYESGALVFGGGHVVLPLLSDEVVTTGWLSESEFMAGYGAAQAMPGPLFTFSSFVGSALEWPYSPWLLSAVALIGVFLPSWLLVLGVMPFWDQVRTIPAMRNALAGTNAAVVGLLGAALYSPVWTGAIRGTGDVIFLLGVAAMLLVWNLPPWLVVIVAALAGWLFL